MADLIDREKVLEILRIIGHGRPISGKRAISLISEMPTAEQPKQRHGRWIAVSSFDAFGGDEEAWMAHGNPTAYHYCSECKNESYLNEEGKEILSDYCPFCGADMRDGGADNDSE